MEKLVSSWHTNKPLPQASDKRPGKDHAAAPCSTIPVIDLEKADGDDWDEIIQQILDASQDFCFFQVIDHGVREGLMDDTMNVFLGFFDMPREDKAELYSADPSAKSRLYTSNDYTNKEFTFEGILLGADSVRVRNMLPQILELMREGLALQSNTFGEELTKGQILLVNHYPPCPEPSLTLGLPKPYDPNLMTAVHQGNIPGLQVLKDGKWTGVEAPPNAFVVDVGHQLQVITNGKLKSAEHRAVTNSSYERTSVVTFLVPDSDRIIELARALLDNKPPPYRGLQVRRVYELSHRKGR